MVQNLKLTKNVKTKTYEHHGTTIEDFINPTFKNKRVGEIK